jgi:Mn-dependent DtxR family transcriptional regulator
MIATPKLTDADVIKAIRDTESTQRVGATLAQLGARLGFTKQYLHKKLHDLEREGIVERLHTGYGLTKTGKRLAR